jgi:hypothetical protein
VRQLQAKFWSLSPSCREATQCQAMSTFLRAFIGSWLRLVCGTGLVVLVACEAEAVDAKPERVVEAFIERMASVHGDPVRGRAALALLAKKARENLDERAVRASAAAGRKMEPEEMLVPSRFLMNFAPKSYRAELAGGYARVFVQGPNPTDIAEVHCVLEDGHWRVVLALPELPMIQKRGE